MNVEIKRILSGDASADVAFVVLEGTLAGCPQATHRRSIAAAALASGQVSIAAEKAALIATVEANYANWQAVHQALAQL